MRLIDAYEAEPTFEQIEEYCRKRHLVIITSELFNWMKSGRSTEQRKCGQWVDDKGLYKCTACNALCTIVGWARCISEEQMYRMVKYCPNCGAKMEADHE